MVATVSENILKELSMSSLYEQMIAYTPQSHFQLGRELTRFTPMQIRETLAQLVAQDRLDLAAALSDAGMSLYPDSEDILSITALLHAVQGNWIQTENRLMELLEVQGANTTAFSWRLLVRSLRCQLEYRRAWDAVNQGLTRHPADAELLAEQAALRESVTEFAGLTTPASFH